MYSILAMGIVRMNTIPESGASTAIWIYDFGFLYLAREITMMSLEKYQFVLSIE